MIKERLFGYKTIKLGGVRFVIKRLTPSLFTDSEHFPLNNVIESESSTDAVSKVESNLDEIKKTFREIIVKGVVKVKYIGKSLGIEEIIDEIMEKEDTYNPLFLEIMTYSLRLKKKGIFWYGSIGSLRSAFIRCARRIQYSPASL